MFYLFVVLIFLVLLKLYNKLNSGWCYSKTIMTGKVVIVTGANSGIGYESALNMAKRGAKVVLASRDVTKTTEVAKQISIQSKNSKVYCLHLDLCALASVRKFVEEFGAKEYKLDVLINNAGSIGKSDEYSEDGIVKNMQTNHFGPFLLTVLLLPYLKRAESSRIIFVSSDLHRFGKIDFGTINKLDNSLLGAAKIYSCSKLCNVIFANELARRLKCDDIMINSLHPGIVNTDILRNFIPIPEKITKTISIFLKTPVEGAQTTIYLSVADIDSSGGYYVDCKLAKPSKLAQNENLAKRLWEYSETLVKLQDGEKIR